MLPVDNVFLSALRGSVVFDVVVNVYEGTGLIYEGLKIVDGSVTADRESNVRRTLDCTVAMHEWEEVPLDVIDTRLQVWMGFNIGGSPTMLPVGVFKVDSIQRVNRGTLNISGTSFESYVIDNKYIGSTDEVMTYPAGSNVVDTIKDIILTSFADASFEIMTSVDVTAVLTADVIMAVEQTYWDAAEILANKLGAEIFCTPTGKVSRPEAPTVQGHCSCCADRRRPRRRAGQSRDLCVARRGLQRRGRFASVERRRHHLGSSV